MAGTDTEPTLPLVVVPAPVRWTVRRAAARLVRFAWLELASCVFPIALFVGLAAAAYIPLPMPRYDALLIYVVGLTVLLWVLRLESGREVAVIFGFHLLGLALELYKVRVGSWAYPWDAWSMVGGVPLYAGFMYAAVGSYLCQAWRRFDLRVSGYRTASVTVIAVAIYVNFFTHHHAPDLRWLLAVALLVALRGTWVHFTVGPERLRMPLALSFVLIGGFLWLAENMGTFLGAWRYPDQAEVWTVVHAGKFGSWALLVSLSFALVASVKSTEGLLYGTRGDRASVAVSKNRLLGAGRPH